MTASILGDRLRISHSFNPDGKKSSYSGFVKAAGEQIDPDIVNKT